VCKGKGARPNDWLDPRKHNDNSLELPSATRLMVLVPLGVGYPNPREFFHRSNCITTWSKRRGAAHSKPRLVGGAVDQAVPVSALYVLVLCLKEVGEYKVSQARRRKLPGTMPRRGGVSSTDFFEAL